MAIQYSTAIRNAKSDAFESTVGTAAKLYVWTNAPPADCATPSGGTALALFDLPSDWMAAASGGVKAKSGTWSTTAVSAGTPGHFRIYDSSLTTCHLQGTAGVGSGDLSFDSAIAVGATVVISAFSLTEGNA
jgi:hypothetical protein